MVRFVSIIKNALRISFDVMDAPWKTMWPLKLLVRRRIQEILANNTCPGGPTAVERASRLELPPLLSRLVVSDTVEVETENWDHLAMTEVPPIHNKCSLCRPSARRIWLSRNPGADKSEWDSQPDDEKEEYKKLAKAARAERLSQKS